MTKQDIRSGIDEILEVQAEALADLATAREAMQRAFEAHDKALRAVIDANMAAVTLVRHLRHDEGRK